MTGRRSLSSRCGAEQRARSVPRFPLSGLLTAVMNYDGVGGFFGGSVRAPRVTPADPHLLGSWRSRRD